MYPRSRDLIQGFVVAQFAWGRDHVLWRLDRQLPLQPTNRVRSSPRISREQGRLPDTIMNSASQREIEDQLVMDRLLREYLTPKSRWE